MATASPWLDNATMTAPRRPQEQNREVLRRRFKWWTFLLSVLNLGVVVGLVFLTTQISENWWLSGALTYVPQTPFLIPSICLLACSLFWHMKSALINLTAIGLALVFLCGARFSMKSVSEIPDSSRNVRLITCNVQDFEPNFGQVLREIARFKPDVLVLQEARHVPSMLTEYLAGWHWQHEFGFLVGSKWPVSKGETCHTSPYDRHTAMVVRIDAPCGPVLLSNVHLMTARRGLTDLSVTSILDGSGPASSEHHAFLRDEEARQTQTYLAGVSSRMPKIVAGDFNMPTSSSIFNESFGQYSDAFDEAGVGFGYTAPCRPVRFWLPKVPWLRIDHILTSQDWETLHCEAGEFNGSDHRLVAAVLQLRDETAPPP
ncbi:MAG: endonuclease/exonuclease/phosphatase family protein [Planctomycetota bacterium]|nr:endonuclease/exonuclease/phosphatase family protein [Planctomycetota bacterium]